MTQHQTIIIGGGVSGLAFAHKAAAEGETLLLEASPRLGGCLHTERLESGFWFELGAHTTYNSYGGFIEMLEASGAMEKLRERTKVPFRLWTDQGAASIGKALAKLPLFAGVLKLPFLSKEGKTVEEYYSAIAGKKNFRGVVSGLLAAVPSQSADGFPANMLFKKRPRRKDVLRSFTLDGGLQTAVDAIAARDGLTVRTEAPVASLAPDGEGFLVTLEGGETLRAATVALALPPDVAAKIVAARFPALAEALGRIAMARIETMGVVLPASKCSLEPVAGIVPSGDDLFWSVVSRDILPDADHRGFAFHFRPDTTREERLARITEILGVGEADFLALFERQTALPAPARGHETIAKAIDDALAGGRLAVSGAFFAGLAIEDCIGRSFEEWKRVTA